MVVLCKDWFNIDLFNRFGIKLERRNKGVKIDEDKDKKKEDEPAIKLYAGTGDSDDYEGGPHGLPQKLYDDAYEEEQKKKRQKKEK